MQNLYMKQKLSTRWVVGFFPHLKAVIWKLDQVKLSYTNSNHRENQQIFGILPVLCQFWGVNKTVKVSENKQEQKSSVSLRHSHQQC